MRKTYAYNSITLGVLLGILVGLSSKSAVLGVLAGLGVAVVGFIVIRLIENALYKGVDKAADKITDAYHRRKEQKAAENGTYVPPVTTQFPNQSANTTQFPTQPAANTTQFPTQPAAEAAGADVKFCPYCGAQIKRSSKFCPACGASLGN